MGPAPAGAAGGPGATTQASRALSKQICLSFAQSRTLIAWSCTAWQCMATAWIRSQRSINQNNHEPVDERLWLLRALIGDVLNTDTWLQADT